MELLPLLTELLVLLAGVILTAAINHLRKYLNAKASNELNSYLNEAVTTAVWAVEQKHPAVFGTKDEHAAELVRKALKERGLQVNDDLIRAAIEATVGQNFHYAKHTREAEAPE